MMMGGKPCRSVGWLVGWLRVKLIIGIDRPLQRNGIRPLALLAFLSTTHDLFGAARTARTLAAELVTL
jgi:hypothetical protein